MGFHKVCSLSQLEFEKPTKFLIQDVSLFVAKSSDNKVWAYSSTCSHADKPLDKALWNPQTTEVTCPFHKAIFNISENGAVKAPPAFISLPTYNVEIRTIDGENLVFVSIED